MRVKRDICDHKAYGAVRVTVDHSLPFGGAIITVPDDGDTSVLGLDWVREVLDHHVEKDCVQGAVLGQPLHIAAVALLIDLFE